MKFKKTFITILVFALAFTTFNAQESKAKIKEIAAQFVKGADIQDATLLQKVLEPNSIQYVLMGGKFNIFTANQYITMVEEKKLGGKPRKITFKHAEFLSKNLAVVVLNAVSSEYDFLYQISLGISNNDKWKIIGVSTEINGI
ncbi:nuclear transport factor 2 family protein [Aquimarina gracilis]|uniref:Nuclear transport factor 2 family protein n=1 Tax=Aquimarina gracilis TaxID=874422 RepID=A0ABU5ZP31_9FLAO|nr:nuclear transport factor 2 family protein [Aquimarina gracilis]MEB3343903.1 nuclear transport factor 2 family protein [Aquimarina gracilis]